MFKLHRFDNEGKYPLDVLGGDDDVRWASLPFVPPAVAFQPRSAPILKMLVRLHFFYYPEQGYGGSIHELC